jgi:hypothetical protein
MRAAPCIERAKGGRKSGELFLPDFEIDGLGSAFIAAGISFFAGAAASRVMAFVLPLQASEGGWATYALGLALSIGGWRSASLMRRVSGRPRRAL